MNRKSKLVWFGMGLVVALAVWLVSCGPAATRGPSYVAAAPTAMAKMETVPAPAAATRVPVPGNAAGAGGVQAPPVYQPAVTDRKIIKNAEMQLLVENTDVAVDRVTGVAAQYGGYILNVQSWYDEGYKEATVTFAVPSESFEQALRRVREVALRVESETASGQDVTDQYVDLESQLRNLEATATRIRGFLDMADTVTEALRINDELSNIEGQIEVVKGKLYYIEGRAAFSTITVDIHPPRPTPTPTLTPTPTPTPTPVVWRPGETFQQAGTTLGTISRSVVDALIWIAVVIVPVLGLPILLVLAIFWAWRRSKKRPPTPA